MSSLMLNEIQDIPKQFKALLEAYENSDSIALLQRSAEYFSNAKEIPILTAMGTSLFSLYYGIALLHAKGIHAYVYESGEMLHYPPSFIHNGHPLLVVSQSGESIELLKILEQCIIKSKTENKTETHEAEFSDSQSSNLKKYPMVAITNQPDSSVGSHASLVLPLHAGEEQGPSTKTYINSLGLVYILMQTIISKFNLEDYRPVMQVIETLLPLIKKQKTLIDTCNKTYQTWVEFFAEADFINCIARGYSVCSMHAAALVLKETAKVFAEPITTASFNHGPIETLQHKNHHAILFGTDEATCALQWDLATKCAEYDSKILFITTEALMKAHITQQDTIPSNIRTIALPNCAADIAPMLEIIPIQFLAMGLAESRSIPAGSFQVGAKVTNHE